MGMQALARNSAQRDSKCRSDSFSEATVTEICRPSFELLSRWESLCASVTSPKGCVSLGFDNGEPEIALHCQNSTHRYDHVLLACHSLFAMLAI